jgi:hypothetical protein
MRLAQVELEIGDRQRQHVLDVAPEIAAVEIGAEQRFLGQEIVGRRQTRARCSLYFVVVVPLAGGVGVSSSPPPPKKPLTTAMALRQSIALIWSTDDVGTLARRET